MKYLAWIMLLATMDSWVVEFNPHPDNVGVTLVTTCFGAKPYFAYNRMDIDSSTRRMSFRRQPTPEGETCRVTTELLRNLTPNDPTTEFVAESAVQ